MVREPAAFVVGMATLGHTDDQLSIVPAIASGEHHVFSVPEELSLKVPVLVFAHRRLSDHLAVVSEHWFRFAPFILDSSGDRPRSISAFSAAWPAARAERLAGQLEPGFH